MHRFYSILFSVVLLCCGTPSYLTLSDYDQNVDFKEYHSFTVLSNNNMDQSQSIAIEQAITKRLQAMGYQEAQKPTFYVNYQIVSGKFNIRTYQQLSLAFFLSDSRHNESGTIKSEMRQMDGPVLMINIFDPVNNKVIWRGQSLNKSGFDTYRQLVHSVNKILDEYVVVQRFETDQIAKN